MESLEKGLQPKSGETPLLSIITGSLASWQGCRSVDAGSLCKWALKVRLYWSESDIASRWVHSESNLMFRLSIDKDQGKIRFRSVYLKYSHQFLVSSV